MLSLHLSALLVLLIVLLVAAALLATDLAAAAGAADTAQCIASCSLQHSGGPQVTFCGDDGATHSVPRGALTSQCVVTTCFLTPLHFGSCGCPNDCGALFETPTGSCDTIHKRCKCDAGWGGGDCASVVCPLNKCSGHGECVVAPTLAKRLPDSEHTDADGAHYCRCAAGWTDPYCSTPTLSGVTQAPFGTVLPDPRGRLYGWEKSPYHHGHDEYGDAGGLFDLEHVATLNMTMPRKRFLQLINAKKVFSNPYLKINLTASLKGGHDRFFFATGAKARAGGATSRTDTQKKFNIKFSKNRLLKGQRKLGVKFGGGAGADSLLKAFLQGSLARALSMPVARSSFAMLWITLTSDDGSQQLTSFLAGIYFMDEKTNQREFLQSRFGDAALVDSAFFSLGPGVELRYLGPFADNYTSVVTPIGRGLGELHHYTLASVSTAPAAAAWPHYIAFVDKLNALYPSELEPSDLIHVEELVRVMAVDSLLSNFDGFGSGNNFAAVRFSSSSPDSLWRITTKDFDYSFVTRGEIPNPYAIPSRNLFTYAVSFVDTPPPFDPYFFFNPLRKKVFSATRWKALLAEYVALLVEATRTADAQSLAYAPTSLRQWYHRLGAQVAPLVGISPYQRALFGNTRDEFERAVAVTLERLEKRWQEVCAQQLAPECAEAKLRLCPLKCIAAHRGEPVFGVVTEHDHDQERWSHSSPHYNASASNPPGLEAWCGLVGGARRTYITPAGVEQGKCMVVDCKVQFLSYGECEQKKKVKCN